ncbi:MAG TPA: ABC transporter C-terminal domain-containing protein, partial [Candidatus Acidoferrum sp.]|nr:ABC transporter C-terminal domain-containing protein [Candidatus Acidoferrum sp.]
ICDQIVAFEDGGIFVQPGNYSYYQEKRKEREERYKNYVPPAASISKSDAATRSNTRARKLSFKEQRELDGMEAAIHALEARLHELETLLNDPTFYATRAADAPKIVSDIESTRADIARLYSRWEELEAIPK